MSTMDIENIKTRVTHFSEQLRLDAEHLQEVTVAGKIMSIITPLYDDPGTNSLAVNYCVELDDTVGRMYVYVSPVMMTHYEEILKTGNMVIFNGYANVITREIKNNVRKEVSVVAYDVKPFEVQA